MPPLNEPPDPATVPRRDGRDGRDRRTMSPWIEVVGAAVVLALWATVVIEVLPAHGTAVPVAADPVALAASAVVRTP